MSEFLREEEVLSILVDLVIHEGASQDEIIKKFNDLTINEKDDEKNDNDNTSKTNDDTNDDDSKTDDKKDSSSTDQVDTNEENSSKSNSDKSDDTDDENEPEEEDDDEDDDENETEEEKRTRYATLAAEILNDNTENSDNNDSTDGNDQARSANNEDDDYANDTIDSFNSRLHQEDEAFGQPNHFPNDDEAEEPHANANLSEDQIRSKPVIGDFLKIALFDTQIISNILSMFFKFPWNNFLHNVVFDIVQQVLNGSMDIGFNKFLAIDLFNRGDITNKIIEGQSLCSEYEAKHNGLRLGFMGHLTLIAEEVVKFIQLYPVNSLSEIIDQKIEDEVWSNYVSHVLYDTREKYNAILGGEEEEESSQTFDEGSGDIIEADDLQSDLLYDPKEYHDIVETGHDDNSDRGEDHDHHERIDEKDEPEEEESELPENKPLFTKKSPQKDDNDDEEIKSKKAETNKSNSSDESESDDDDHFTTYMTQQLTNTASITPSVTKVTNEDNKIINEDNKKEESKSQFPESYDSQPFQDEFDDEYIDPNDDGLSYKKSNPLYDSEGTLKTHSDLSILDHHTVDEDDLSSSSSSSDNEDGVLLDYEEDFPREDGHKLTRAASKVILDEEDIGDEDEEEAVNGIGETGGLTSLIGSIFEEEEVGREIGEVPSLFLFLVGKPPIKPLLIANPEDLSIPPSS
ncbi:hypothetical protein QCA50_020617 [Cerrena zonata]|uniref:Uncharacterized protein n=1 Tax=Cerrena zonata TaxID=2478898 RepID=A0AAW0F8X5_9APHY